MTSRLRIWHLALIFLLAALPFAATFVIPYPDERHYTDGAMAMLRDHDWAAPKTPEGRPRFNKPPLAYWATAAGFAALGVNPLAARLPSLLAGCATLFLTWRLARKLTGSDSSALVAAVILLSHYQFLLASVRALPDIWLCLFILVSAEGFLRLLLEEEPAADAFWLAYGGAALAAMSKGLLGLGIVLFAWTFAFAGKGDFRAVKRLWHWPSMAAAALFVGGWFALILKGYGLSAWRVFFADQVTDNLHGHVWSPLWRAPVFVLIQLLNFLPWSLPALEAWRRGAGSAADGGLNPRARRFILAWCGALAAGFALGENLSVRYLLPAAPLGAVLVADLLGRADERTLCCSPRRILIFILGIDLLLVAVAVVINTQWELSVSVLLAAGLFALMAVLTGLGALRRGWLSPAQGLGLALILIFPLIFLSVNRIVLPDPCEQMAVAVQHTGLPPQRPILVIGRPALASGVRLFLGGEWKVVRADTLNQAGAHLADFEMVLTPQADAGTLKRQGGRLVPAAVIPRLPARQWWPALQARRLPEALEENGRRYFLAIPQT
jgi:4-amino-4-deoxy-L-arabinose transferase-like glycosyltransferase